MRWIYETATGNTRHPKYGVAVGYSGHGVGLNNPAFENVKNIGPIPCGIWHVGTPVEHSHLGPYAVPLTPAVGTDTHGRTAFFIHSDRKDCATHPHEASEGCIILPYKVRQQIVASHDDLEVVSGLPVQDDGA